MTREFGKNEGFILSTDCVGRFGSLGEMEKVWDFAIKEPAFQGYEVIGWKNIMEGMGRHHERGLKVMGIHGRMGTHPSQGIPSKMKASLLDSNIIPTVDLLKRDSEFPYILLHSVSLDKERNMREALDSGPSVNTVILENHVQKGALQHAFDKVAYLREKGINTGLMIDIVHYFYENSIRPQDMSVWWSGMVFEVERTIKTAKRADPNIPVGIHLPIGTREADSLFMDHITKKEWQALANVIHNYPNIPVVLENQQEGVGLFFLAPADALVQKGRNRKNFETLVANEVILV